MEDKKIYVIGKNDKLNESLKIAKDVGIIDNSNDPYLNLLNDNINIINMINHDYNYYEPIPKKIRGLKAEPVRNSKEDPKIGRNDLCPCNSGKKYKNCCINKPKEN